MKPERVEHRLAELEREREAEARFEIHAQQWQKWIDEQIISEVEGGGLEHEPPALLAEGLAALGSMVEDEQAESDARMRHADGELRRQLVEMSISHIAERRGRVEEASALRRRIAVLETRLRAEKEAREGLAKALAALDHTIAKDRAHRRLLDARRSYPRSSRADLERARRATDAAIEDRLSEEGAFDA